MKISVKRVALLKESKIVELYQGVITKANKSGDRLRIKAAKRVDESRLRLVKFLNASKTWEVKRGRYDVPRSDFLIVDAVSIFIKPESIFTKIIESCGRDKSR